MKPSKSYFSYFWHSKGRHGIHSPFVFDFVDTCLTQKLDKCFLQKRKKWIQERCKEKEKFEIVDLGAGSKQLKPMRSIAQLIKTNSSNGIYGSILWKIARHYQPKMMLELGTSIGTGSIHLKMGSPDSQLITVEGCSETQRRAVQQFDYWKLDHITTINASFDEFLSLPAIGPYDLIYIDGNHQGEATLKYVDLLYPNTHTETIIILDDIRWSIDMWAAWNKLTHDSRFHLSIDLGRMGILWRKESQVKEHFTIRPWILKSKLL